MGAVPAKKFREVKQALERNGYREARQKGSHVIFTNGSKSVTVPNHNGADVSKGVLRRILDETGLTAEELFDKRRGREPMELLREGNPPPGSRGTKSAQSSKPAKDRGGGRGRGRGRGD
ncbi:type II toxin-antitoxin system HicA family toxin [Kribbella sp. NPDC051770]|uniref:type II toxin-antitoxin system HicA family toxin n=1 Tax=Kribbella sp. NPDC051770 TaxID=3155413 RepID=UPI00341B383E